MKIVKQGVLPITSMKRFRGECYSCGCEVECLPDEVSLAERSSPYSYTVRWWYVKCPTAGCSKDIVLDYPSKL